MVRGVLIRVVSKGGHPKVLHRPLQHIYPLEFRCEPTSEEPSDATHNAELGEAAEPSQLPVQITESTTSSPMCRRSTQMAANQARDRILGCVMTD